MRSTPKTSVPSFGFLSIEFDRPDGFHNPYGPMNAGASLARALNDRGSTASAEESERLRQRLGIDEFGKQHGYTGMTTERRREIINAYNRIAEMGRPE
ncbi:hypothetical protein [Bifidobacterium longum]|uniref:Uncharacterized protein n=2 Tax=Bifidobacterium longum TaxID=216816 RepID=A0A3E4S7C7_BIFLN|nr:hypothetical protein [Bifidobacterium longum]MBH8619101.1 hypothetical protein [Bifidobacterium longum subsp. longum]RGL51023.1 hypothetical protein DXC63_03025 [Bifidobacterium longum]RGL65665.1 hypothetical protein DXC54_05970 [Bifidobacterium longum]RGN28538.1 hypothetical protein DXB68_00985 [Bifidobacterium longum]TCF04725.1 hypothetical protein MCC10078_0214 [Bifidobacterium longum subsp. longum]